MKKNFATSIKGAMISVTALGSLSLMALEENFDSYKNRWEMMKADVRTGFQGTLSTAGGVGGSQCALLPSLGHAVFRDISKETNDVKKLLIKADVKSMSDTARLRFLFGDDTTVWNKYLGGIILGVHQSVNQDLAKKANLPVMRIEKEQWNTVEIFITSKDNVTTYNVYVNGTLVQENVAMIGKISDITRLAMLFVVPQTTGDILIDNISVNAVEEFKPMEEKVTSSSMIKNIKNIAELNQKLEALYPDEEGEEWKLVGPCAGGAYSGATLSADGKKLFVMTNMGSSFVGEANKHDTYKAVSQELFSTWIYSNYYTSPYNLNLALAGSLRGMIITEDAGKTWRKIDGPWDEVIWEGKWPPAHSGPYYVSFSPNGKIYAFFSRFQHKSSDHYALFESSDTGKTWKQINLPQNYGGVTASLFFKDGSSLWAFNKALVKLNANNQFEVVKNMDNNVTLTTISGNENLLYLVLNHANKKGEVLVSKDKGKSFETRTVRNGAVVTHLQACGSAPENVYFLLKNLGRGNEKDLLGATVYKSSDALKNYKATLCSNSQMKDYNISPFSWTSSAWGWQMPIMSIAVSYNNPNCVTATTISEVFFSSNSGKTWSSQAAPFSTKGKTTPQGGIPNLSVYGYYIDPHNHDYRYTATNDFCNWFSYDGNKTWAQYNKGNDFPHNVYEMVIDPDVAGKIYAGATREHDLPHWKWNNIAKLQNAGGFITSTDYGKSWTTMPSSENNLPGGNITSITLDPSSPKDSRKLWVAMCGIGIYTSDDGGVNWRPQKNGIDNFSNRVYKVVYDKYGRLWVVTTIGQGSLFVSNDKGESFKRVYNDSSMPKLTTIAIDKNNENVIFLSSFSEYPFNNSDGGIVKSSDGGKSFKKVLPFSSWGVFIHPEDSNIVIATSYGHGLYISRDGGENWARVKKFLLPCPLSVTFDPKDKDNVYVTCFGGSVWQSRL